MIREKFLKIIGVVMIVSSLSLGVGSLSLAGANAVSADTVSDLKDGVTGSGGGGAKNSSNRLPIVIKTVVNILLFFVGAFAVIMIVIAGFRFVTANGDSNTVSSARNTILYAVIGLVVAFMAFALVNFITRQL